MAPPPSLARGAMNSTMGWMVSVSCRTVPVKRPSQGWPCKEVRPTGGCGTSPGPPHDPYSTGLVDGVFSPSLSCPWALPGNMKKRLLMPSRGKAWGGRWWGAMAESCRDACVCCLPADWEVQGTYRGSPHRPRPQPTRLCSCRLITW